MSSRHQRSKYRLLGLVGNGQFGRVYCGVHRQTGQLVAIKCLHRHSLPTHAFLRELHCLWQLSHPNIVACHAMEHVDDGRRLVLEYCVGGTLRSHMLTPLSLSDILTLVSDILQGLTYAHTQGIIHCDIKPENVLLNYREGRWRAKISDFGIAKLVQESAQRPKGSGQTGSPAYMAPERFYHQYSPATDVYSVGIMLFELLVGERPFSGTPTALQSAHLSLPVPKKKLLFEPLIQVTTRALEKLPARRYQTAAEMLKDIQQLYDVETTPLQLANPFETTYTPYAGLPLQRLNHSISHLQATPAPSASNSVNDQQTDCVLVAHGSALSVLKQHSQVVFQHRLDGPVQGVFSAENNLMVSTEHTLWSGSTPESLAPLHRWQTPVITAVAPNHRWTATVDIDATQLTITPLHAADRQICQFLPPDTDICEILAVDNNHIAVVADSGQAGSQLLLWNRRGLYLTSLSIGVTLRQLTPMGRRHQWMAIDAHSPQTVLLLTLKPLRMTRIVLTICPVLMLELLWGYLFVDAQGQMLLLDRDFCVVGGIQGPSGITALTSLNSHELLVATWQQDDPAGAALHRIDLYDFALDLIF